MRQARILCVILSGLLAAPTSDVYAQSGEPGIVLAQAERPGIFRFLFKNRRQRRAEPRREFRILPTFREERRQDARPRKQRQADKPRKQRKKRAAVAAAPPEKQAVEKLADAKRVLVIGDFMAGALAKGLTDSFKENPNIVIVDANKGDSGLVRADFYEWPTQLPTLLTEHRADAIVAMIGANDRQSIGTQAGSRAVGSDGWRAAYTTRVAALADALKTSTKPVIWAGLAPVKPSSMARDYSAFNGIVREQLESKGMRYVDVWNGFSDEAGKFVEAGPDVSGQPAQLRDSDGLNFTRAGQRKLAFFVERELIELLGGAALEVASTTPAGAANLEPADQGPRIGPMIPLDGLAAATADTLSVGPQASDVAATAPEAGRGAVAAIIAKRVIGEAKTAPAARADNFVWPAPVLPGAAARPPLPPVATAPPATPPAAAAAP